MLNIVTALRSESQPLIEHLSLKALETHRKPYIYGRDNVNLVISGVGPAKSSEAVKRLAAFNAAHSFPPTQAWINIGIAGHRTENLGSCFIVDKIMEQVSGKISFPSIPYHTAIASSHLCTVLEPETHYQENTLYDMEGFSFFSEAQHHTALELIMLLKIVSDNQEQPMENINKTIVKNLIESALPSIDEILAKLRALIDRNFETRTTLDVDWQRMWHTTYAQRQILEDCYSRINLLDENLAVLPLICDCKSAKEAISVLEETISEMPMQLAVKP